MKRPSPSAPPPLFKPASESSDEENISIFRVAQRAQAKSKPSEAPPSRPRSCLGNPQTPPARSSSVASEDQNDDEHVPITVLARLGCTHPQPSNSPLVAAATPPLALTSTNPNATTSSVTFSSPRKRMVEEQFNPLFTIWERFSTANRCLLVNDMKELISTGNYSYNASEQDDRETFLDVFYELPPKAKRLFLKQCAGAISPHQQGSSCSAGGGVGGCGEIGRLPHEQNSLVSSREQILRGVLQECAGGEAAAAFWLSRSGGERSSNVDCLSSASTFTLDDAEVCSPED